MARISTGSIVPGFPAAAKTAAPGGRFGGALLGLQEAKEIGTARSERALKTRTVDIRERSAKAAEVRNVISILNKRNDQIAKERKTQVGGLKYAEAIASGCGTVLSEW